MGGLYGIQLGGVFFGESMFSLERDASKVALARLIEECRARDIRLIDCQVASAPPGLAWAPARSRAVNLRRYCAVTRGAARAAAGPAAPA